MPLARSAAMVRGNDKSEPVWLKKQSVVRWEDINDVVSCLRSLRQTEKGQQPEEESTAMFARQTVFLSSAAWGSEGVWSLADTAVEMQVYWRELFSQQQCFLLFGVSSGKILEVE